MKKNFCARITTFGLMLALSGTASRAVAKEPTIDERFRNATSDPSNNATDSDLPYLNAPQSKLVQRAPERASEFPRPRSIARNVPGLPAPAQATSGPAYLGVTFGDEEQNAVVRSVAPGSPAEQAGLKPGDVIETLQGITIGAPEDVQDIVAKMRPGTMLDVGVSRRISLHAQAPLAAATAGAEPLVRNVNYPPEASDGGFQPTSQVSQEPMPVPAGVRSNQFNSFDQPRAVQPNRNMNAVPQRQNLPAAGQRNNTNQNNNRSDDNRGFLFLRGRR